MDSIQQKQEKLIGEFTKLSDWEERYARIIKMGKELPSMSDDLKTEENRIKGCQSQVWLFARLEKGCVFYEADSDATIVRGLAALMVHVFSGHTPDEILASSTDFIQEIGLMKNLSQSRANGLGSLVKQIKNYAIAFKHLQFLS